MTAKQEWVTPNAFAGEVGVSARAVLNAIQNDRFTKDALKEVQTKSGKTRYQIKLKLGKTQWDTNRKEPVRSVSDEEFTQAKRREQVAKAEIEEMKAKQIAGELVLAEDIKKHFTKISIVVRDAVLTEAVKLAPIVANMENAKEVENTILGAMTEVLEELSHAGRSGAVFK